MSKFYSTLALVFLAVAGWGIGAKLDAGSLAMTVGICFGVMAGIPATLLLIASERHRGTPQPHHERQVTVQPQVTHIHHTHNHLHVSAAPGQLDRRLEIEARHR